MAYSIWNGLPDDVKQYMFNHDVKKSFLTLLREKKSRHLCILLVNYKLAKVGRSMLPFWSNHVFYVLLTSEYWRRNSENACMSQPCSWLPPSLKEVEFAELSNIDFSDPRKRLSKKKVNAQNKH